MSVLKPFVQNNKMKHSSPQTLIEEPELFDSSLEGSCELVGRPWLGRGLGSTPATPTHLLAPPLERSGQETPASVDSLPLEWDHTGDVGGSSSHEDDEDDREGEGTYFSALSGKTSNRHKNKRKHTKCVTSTVVCHTYTRSQILSPSRTTIALQMWR